MPQNDAGNSLPLAAARERYEQEREKRLRSDGMEQFVELKGDYSAYDRDPYADAKLTREPVTETTEVVIVGAGFAGMLTAVNLL